MNYQLRSFVLFSCTLIQFWLMYIVIIISCSLPGVPGCSSLCVSFLLTCSVCMRVCVALWGYFYLFNFECQYSFLSVLPKPPTVTDCVLLSPASRSSPVCHFSVYLQFGLCYNTCVSALWCCSFCLGLSLIPDLLLLPF